MGDSNLDVVMQRSFNAEAAQIDIIKSLIASFRAQHRNAEAALLETRAAELQQYLTHRRAVWAMITARDT